MSASLGLAGRDNETLAAEEESTAPTIKAVNRKNHRAVHQTDRRLSPTGGQD